MSDWLGRLANWLQIGHQKLLTVVWWLAKQLTHLKAPVATKASKLKALWTVMVDLIIGSY